MKVYERRKGYLLKYNFMSIWQTNSWKNLLLQSNQASEVFEIDSFFIEKRSVWWGQFWLFMLWVWEESDINEQKLIDLCKKEKCLFIQIESFDILWIKNKYIFNQFKSWYYKKFITPYTAIIDLQKSQEEILAEMKPKWRYNINLAEKKLVTVFTAEKTDENIKIFYDLMWETTKRDKFNGNTFEYYKSFLNIITNSELIFTKIWDKILSAGIFIFEKDVSIYYYGASTSDREFKNLMAPYSMQWYAIKKAKELWSNYYDFLWIASPGDEKSSLLWVTDFKLKFTKNIVNGSESYIYIHNPFKYFLFTWIKKIKSFFG